MRPVKVSFSKCDECSRLVDPDFERVVVYSEPGELPADFCESCAATALGASVGAGLTFRARVAAFEQILIDRAMRDEGSISGAAKALGVGRSTLSMRLLRQRKP